MGSELVVDEETQALRESTVDLINSRPYEIKLVRKGEFARTGSGGQKRSASPTPQKTIKRYFGGVSGNPMILEGANGERHQATYVLIGDWNDDIQKYDEFNLYGKDYRVVGVDEASRGYQTKAWVIQK